MKYLDKLDTAARDAGPWDTPTQLNLKATKDKRRGLLAFKQLAWLLRENHLDLLLRLVEEELEYLAEHTNLLEQGAPRSIRKARRKVRVEGRDDLDALARRVEG